MTDLAEGITAHVDRTWADHVMPALTEYITIPNVSEAYDAAWKANGHMDRAVALVSDWCRARPITGLTVEVKEIPGRSPLVVIEVAARGVSASDDTVLLYGHLDKQPEMTGWRDGLGPWLPVVEGDRLYGRGGGDDGYSVFAALAAIEAAQQAGLPHHRCVVLIEASEESGSPDLPAHLEALGDLLGDPSLVICLDSGCLDYERLWVTTSLRGLATGTLRIDVLDEGVHSGEAGGVVPSSFRVLRALLERLEDALSGELRPPELHVEVPGDRLAEIRDTAAELPGPISSHYPMVPGLRPVHDDPVEQILDQTWRPSLSVTGADGWPPTDRAGNVLRPFTALTLSLRLPPTCDHEQALRVVTDALTTDPPYGARVTFTPGAAGPGWNAPTFQPWLRDALDEASSATFGRSWRAFGEGGSIPFMGMLGQQFPQAQLVVTGVLGPGSNAHGPNEYLHLPTARRLSAAMALLLGAHARR